MKLFKKKKTCFDTKKHRKLMSKYRRYSFLKNVERIADALEEIAWKVGKEKEYPDYFKNGLSKICQNAYAANIRIDEVIKLIKELYPNDKNVEGGTLA